MYSVWQQQSAAGRKTFTFAMNDQRKKERKKKKEDSAAATEADRSDGLRAAMDPNWRLKRQQKQVPDDDDADDGDHHEAHHR